MVLGIVLEKSPRRVAHSRVTVEPVLSLLLCHIGPEARSVTDATVRLGICVVFIEKHVKPEGHLISVVLRSPVVGLLQRSDEQLLIW